MKKLLLLVIVFIMFEGASAQVVQKQLGFRFGVTSGFSGRIIKENQWAVEGILGFRSGGAQLYCLLEQRRPMLIQHSDNFYLYFGGGAHVGFVSWDDYEEWEDDPYYHYDYHRATGVALGFDGIAGIEYTFQTVPVSLTADFKPFFELYGPFRFRANLWDFGFHVRYTF